MNQTRKTLLQLVVMLAVGSGVGGYAWYGVFKKDQADQKKQDHELRFFAPQQVDERQPDGGSPPAEFTKLTVTSKGVTNVLEKKGKDWWLVSPVRARADKLVVDGITSQLQTSKFKDTLDENPTAETLVKYGLSPPQFTVEATAEVNGQARSVTLVGGRENSFDGTIYVRRNDEKAVFTAEGGVRYMLARTTYELRNKTPFGFDETKVKRVSAKSSANEYVVEREASGKQWNLVKPTAEPADATAILSMLTAAAEERAQAFPEDSEATRKALGFDSPLIDATVTLDDDTIVRLRATRQVADGGELFYGLREEGESAVLAQLGPGITQFDRNPADLHDRTVVRFRRELVTKIVLHDPALPEVILEKDAVDASADAWRVIAPRPGKAKIFKVTGALWTLGAFKALTPGEEKPKDWGRYGLDAKGKFVAVFGSDGKELARLTIGKEVIGTPSAFYVRGTRDQVFTSDGSRFGEFPFAIEQVIDEPGVDAGSPDSGSR